jgi:hypothetical protein
MKALTAVVLVHLVLSFVHGAAHSGANVALGLAGNLFVYIVILAGPIVGLLIACLAEAPEARRRGAWIVALTMSGSLAFGLINHFIIQGTDHVSHVAAAWRTQFAVTAALLAVVEAAGAAIGLRDAIRVGRAS